MLCVFDHNFKKTSKNRKTFQFCTRLRWILSSFILSFLRSSKENSTIGLWVRKRISFIRCLSLSARSWAVPHHCPLSCSLTLLKGKGPFRKQSIQFRFQFILILSAESLLIPSTNWHTSQRTWDIKERNSFVQTALRGTGAPTGRGSPSEAQRSLGCCWCGVGLSGHARAPGTLQRRSPGTDPSPSQVLLWGLASPYTKSRTRERSRGYRMRARTDSLRNQVTGKESSSDQPQQSHWSHAYQGLIRTPLLKAQNQLNRYFLAF